MLEQNIRTVSTNVSPKSPHFSAHSSDSHLGGFDCPTNIGITRGTPSVTTLVVVSDLGCSKIFISLTIYGVRNARASVRIFLEKP